MLLYLTTSQVAQFDHVLKQIHATAVMAILLPLCALLIELANGLSLFANITEHFSWQLMRISLLAQSIFWLIGIQ